MLNKQITANWVICPICRQKTRLKYNTDTIMLRFPLFCPKCKREIRIDLIDHKVYKSLEPDS